jgi:hypothetical protein
MDSPPFPSAARARHGVGPVFEYLAMCLISAVTAASIVYGGYRLFAY